MIDECGRQIDHLRLSLTDHCNLACRYCVPDDIKPSASAVRGMDVDFAFALASWLSTRHGLTHIRLTGGEPLLYPQLVPLVRRLAALGSFEEITLTTNGQALSSLAQPLRAAGLSRINVSLDTLSADRFAHLTRGGKIAHTLAGVEAAVRAGLTPVKLNVVAQRGLNADELADIAKWGLARGCVVRFLEVMPIGPLAHVAEQHLVPASEILDRVGERFELAVIGKGAGQPAIDFAAHGEGVRGVIGLIAATTRPFCSQCRRLRITSLGKLVACLHDDARFDLNQWWDGHELDRAGADAMLHEAVRGKPAVGHHTQSLSMLSLGG